MPDSGHLPTRLRRWKTPPDLADPSSTSWHYSAKLGRLGLSFHVHRHTSRNGDRWVFQPVLTYDRRPS